MSGPYGITQVDVPGLLGVYQSARQSRLQEMLTHRQIAREDAQTERDQASRDMLTKVFAQPKPGGMTPGIAPTPNERAAQEGGDPSSGPAQPVAAPQAAPGASSGIPRTDGMQINQEALARLRAFDPKQAAQVDEMIYSADKHHLEQVRRNGEAMAQVAWRLKQIPQAQRAQELQAWAPQLAQMGISADQLSGADLSDNGLDRYYTMGRDLKDLVSEAQPKLRNVGAGDMLIDERNPNAGPVYESPYVKGADGQLYLRPQGGQGGAPAAPKSKAEYDALPPGSLYIDPHGVQRTKGGASPTGSATFP